MIVINLKTYEKSLEKTLFFTDVVSEVVEEKGVRITLCPPSIYLKEAADRFGGIFAQHADDVIPGAYTGSMPVEALKKIKVKGSLLNHSEKKISHEVLKVTIERLHTNSMESIVCASSLQEAEIIVGFNPGHIAIEPPELIGTGVSVSAAKPELISATVEKIKSVNDKIPILCGAGITTKDDVAKALELGVSGVLISSAFVNAEDHKKFLTDMAEVF